jgi:hypothetical protein
MLRNEWDHSGVQRAEDEEVQLGHLQVSRHGGLCENHPTLRDHGFLHYSNCKYCLHQHYGLKLNCVRENLLTER